MQHTQILALPSTQQDWLGTPRGFLTLTAVIAPSSPLCAPPMSRVPLTCPSEDRSLLIQSTAQQPSALPLLCTNRSHLPTLPPASAPPYLPPCAPPTASCPTTAGAHIHRTNPLRVCSTYKQRCPLQHHPIRPFMPTILRGFRHGPRATPPPPLSCRRPAASCVPRAPRAAGRSCAG